ncbi:hypothetical protein EV421DRAFT_348968 [Armillaria borealis]|uniref:Uncharacterized protein n=1 Tax=Armillaria borealis TaxID=47425 RepID=A0AA39IVU4_9AGAR|nr:hypothetical protein EV421DRAFT_348968 [Armillaria borealis]
MHSSVLHDASSLRDLISTRTDISYVPQETQMIPDNLQTLTNALCYVYPQAVSIRAPFYYGDMVCSRANYFLSADSHVGTEEDWIPSCDVGSGTPAVILEAGSQRLEEAVGLPVIFFYCRYLA